MSKSTCSGSKQFLRSVCVGMNIFSQLNNVIRLSLKRPQTDRMPIRGVDLSHRNTAESLRVCPLTFFPVSNLNRTSPSICQPHEVDHVGR